MALSSEDISTIQHAGVALHRASETISDALRLQAAQMVELVSVQPFEVASEQALAEFKTLAGLSMELKSQEERLRNLYASAADLLRTARSPGATSRLSGRRGRAHQPQKEFKAGKAHKTYKTKQAHPINNAKPLKAQTGKLRRSGAANLAPGEVVLSPNDHKVLQYFQKVLKPGEWSAMTGSVISEGAGLPKGSVGVSVTRVIASGAIRRGANGSFALPATASAG